MHVGLERPADARAIRILTEAAFDGVPHGGTEARIVDGLRSAGALALSIVARDGDEIVGHAAFSPVAIGATARGWYGLGPISVRPDRQRRGIGTTLVNEGLQRLRAMDAFGCVLLGDPAYYGRFGFEHDPLLAYHGAPSPYLQRVLFRGSPPTGTVLYHGAFEG